MSDRASGAGVDGVGGGQGGGRRRVMIGIAALVVLAGAGFGIWQYVFSRTHVSTDNAQVEGHITPVLARVGGYVTEVRVLENQRVSEGDTLVVLDERELRARLAEAEAQLNALLASSGGDGRIGQAQAQLRAVQAAAAAAEAAVRQAEVNAARARADLARFEPLGAQDIISDQQLDAARAAAAAADAQVAAARQNAQAAREQVVSAAAGITSADARVAAAQAARDLVALQLSYTRVLAPADGVVSKLAVEIGQLTNPGQPLMSVVPLEDVWVVANLKETEIARVRSGDPVDFTVDAYPGRRFHGEVESISPATGAKFSLLPPDNATGNFTKVIQRIPVRIRVTDAAATDAPLRPGMSAEVVLTTAA